MGHLKERPPKLLLFNSSSWKILGYAVFSHVELFATPWTVACQDSLSMGILQAKYWSGLPWPPPGDLPKPGIKSRSPALQADTLPSEPMRKPWKPLSSVSCSVVSDSLLLHGLEPARLLCPWNFLGKNTGVGCHFLLQDIFWTQGSNLCLPHCRWILYHLRHQGSLWKPLNKTKTLLVTAIIKNR